jgi:hypothetical protein
VAAGMMASQIGCATIVHGGKQEVLFQVNPNDSIVTVDGNTVKSGATKLQRDKQHHVEVTHSGCKSKNFYIQYGMSGYVWGNVFLPPYFISFGLDFLTGAMGKLDVPDEGYFITLECDK